MTEQQNDPLIKKNNASTWHYCNLLGIPASHLSLKHAPKRSCLFLTNYCEPYLVEKANGCAYFVLLCNNRRHLVREWLRKSRYQMSRKLFSRWIASGAGIFFLNWGYVLGDENRWRKEMTLCSNTWVIPPDVILPPAFMHGSSGGW